MLRLFDVLRQNRTAGRGEQTGAPAQGSKRGPRPSLFPSQPLTLRHPENGLTRQAEHTAHSARPHPQALLPGKQPRPGRPPHLEQGAQRCHPLICEEGVPEEARALSSSGLGVARAGNVGR